MRIAELLAELRRLDAYIELDGDRLRLNAPVGALNEHYRRELQERKAEIVTFLRSAQRLAQQQQAIVPLQPQGSNAPIFAVAGHNGDVFCYRTLAQQLGTEQPFFGLQPPGLMEGAEPHTSVKSLAGYFAEQIREFNPDGPLTIAGYCAGGTIAFELARQLSESGRSVTRLVLLGAPYCTCYRFLRGLAFDCNYFLHRAPIHARALIALPVTEWKGYLSGRAQPLRTTIGNAPRDPVMVRRVAVEKATLAAIRRYRPRAFNGHVDLLLPCESWKRSLEAPLRWRRHATTGTEFVGPDGCTGDTMLLPEYAATFASFLKHAGVQTLSSAHPCCDGTRAGHD